MLEIKGCTLGEGKPLICVPVMGKTKEEIVAQVKELAGAKVQMLEWRVDAFENPLDLNALRGTLEEMEPYLRDTILVYTFRSRAQGGLLQLTQDQIYEIHQIAAKTRVADFIDVELLSSKQSGNEIAQLQKMGAKVIVSHHDFNQTPEPGTMNKILEQMKDTGADIVKLAVMPQKETDVLTLLFSTCWFREKYPDQLIITMSMGAMGNLSRIAGETFGSCVTFGSAGQASAPGQLPLEELDQILTILHNSREEK